MGKINDLIRIKNRIKRVFWEEKDLLANDFLIPNEAINLEKKVIYIAVPKTGTTNVRNQLRQKGTAIVPNSHLNIMQVQDVLYVWLLRMNLNTNDSYPTEGLPTDQELRAQAADMFDRFFKFASVRNPWARAVSLYSRREGIQMSGKMSFEAFCEKHFYASDTCHQPTLHKNQLDWLCNPNGECMMDYVYKLENLQTAIKKIEKRTDGRLKLDSGQANVNPHSDARRYRQIYTNRARDIIARRFKKDIEYFGYSF